MLISYHRGQAGIILRVKILNSSVVTGAGLTGLSSSSPGLLISTIADNEATPTAYAQGSSTIETIATLGTYAAPTATKCRFKEVDATNHKGVYEIQIADARFAVTSAKSLLVSISGATNAAETDAVIPLLDTDPYNAITGGATALPGTACTTNASLLTSGTGTDQLSVSGGKILLQATQTGVTIPTVTTLTNLPSIPAGWLTAAGIAASALDGKGDWLVSSSYPANFADLIIDGTTHLLAVDVLRRLGRDLSLPDGTLAAATASTVTLPNSDADSDAVPTDGSLAGWDLVITKNAGVGQQRALGTWAGSGTAGGLQYAISPDWIRTPDATSEYVLVPGAAASGGGDTPGTTTLLSRLTSPRASNLDNLDAAVSTRSTYAGGDTAGTTTLLARLPAARCAFIDQLDPAAYDALIAAVDDVAHTVTLPADGADGNPLNATGGYANTDCFIRVGTGAGGILRLTSWVSGLIYDYDATASATVDATSGIVFGSSNNVSATASLGTNAPHGWIDADAIAPSALAGKGDWSTYAGGAVASVTAPVTLPAIPADWITAAGIAASALAGKGDWLAKATALSTSPTAGTVEHALAAALANAVGKVVQSGTTITTYLWDNSTILRTFTLDSATAPTSRT